MRAMVFDGGRRFGAVVQVAVLVLGLLPGSARGSVGVCEATIAPASVQPGSAPVFDVSIHNTSGPAVHWIQIQRPNTNYLVDAAGLSGWDAVIDPAGMVLTNGELSTGEDFGFQLAVRTGLVGDPVSNWTVRVSDDGGGLAATVCGGSVATEIEGDYPAEGEGQRVSGVASETSFTSATIRWYSDVPTESLVRYGQTAEYDSASTYNHEFTTSHRVDVAGLAAAETYHFQVAGLDASGNPSYSGDNTFVTTAPVTSGGLGGSGGTGVAGGGSNGGATAAAEKVAPTVTVTTKLAAVYREVPQIRGTASDNVAVARVEYSLDAGANWAAAETAARAVKAAKGKKAAGGSGVDFSFTPTLVDEGNFDVLVRAVDTSGNVAVAPKLTLVIDRLPPRLAGQLVSLGSQVLTQDAAGRWPAVVDAEETMVLRAVGGPTAITVEAKRTGVVRTAQSFLLRRDDQTGLWSGVMSFHRAGLYTLEATAVDGAGNVTRSELPGVAVAAPARVTGPDGKPVAGAVVTLFYRGIEPGQWVVWDGESVGQVNPVKTGADGSFGLLAPAGTYYLKVTAPGYQTLVTQQFALERPTPLTPVLRLAARPMLRLGPWTLSLPWPGLVRAVVTPAAGGASGLAAGGGPAGGDAVSAGAGGPAGLTAGEALPGFELPTTDGGLVRGVGLLGKPALVTVLATWAPTVSDQLPALAALQADHRRTVVPLVLGERPGRVRTFVSRGRYGLAVAVDEQAELAAVLGVPAVPTHYLIDRKGVVRQVLTGVRTAAELAAALDRL